jgi:asparagine synthetase B (glutamine-hydrolysing)
MSGWIAIWGERETGVDSAAWAESLRLAVRSGETVSEAQVGPVRLAAWRRSSGEFPRSGTINGEGARRTAWVGQALSDSGDASDAAIEAVSADPISDDALARINGPFAAATIGPSGVRILTDRFRHYPVYFHRSAAACIASTDIRAIVPWLERPAIDPDAFELLLRSGELIDRLTLLEGVELLPPATILEDDLSGRGPRERRYWRMRHEAQPTRTFAQHRDLLAEALKASVARIQKATPRLGVTLSGGLDSRLILGLCEAPSRIPSFTWGRSGCRDISCAAAFARRVGSPHTVRHWEPETFPCLWERGAGLTAGSFGVESMYMLPYTGLLAQNCDVVLNGLAGDAFMGGNFLKLSWIREQSLPALAETSWRWRVTPEQDAAADRLLPGSVNGARKIWTESISSVARERPVDRLNDWLYANRVFRNTNSGTMLLRHQVESHAPFFDNDVADALLAVPHEMKLKHRLYLAVLKRACPAAAAVRWQRTGVPPAWGFAANGAAMAFQRYTKAALKRIGVKAFESITVADPGAWFRGPWQEPAWALARAAAARGLVDREGLESVLEAHAAGANHTRHLGVLAAVELFCRQTVDEAAMSRRPDKAIGAVA